MTRIGYTNTVHGTRRTALIRTLYFKYHFSHSPLSDFPQKTKLLLPFRLSTFLASFRFLFFFFPPSGVRAARSFPLYSCYLHCDLILRHSVVSARLAFFFALVHLSPLAVALGPDTTHLTAVVYPFGYSSDFFFFFLLFTDDIFSSTISTERIYSVHPAVP